MSHHDHPHLKPNDGKHSPPGEELLKEPILEKGEFDQVEIVSEILFGLIMTLTFTCTLRVAVTDRTEVRDMLIAALGCNIVWGLVDAVMYLLGVLTERGHGTTILRYLSRARNPSNARAHIADALPPIIASSIGEDTLEQIRLKLMNLPGDSLKTRFRIVDLITAVRIFFLVFLSTFPVALPFIFIHSVPLALRISNLIAIILMFICGFLLGKYGGHNKYLMGLVMTVLGIVLVLLALLLGG